MLPTSDRAGAAKVNCIQTAAFGSRRETGILCSRILTGAIHENGQSIAQKNRVAIDRSRPGATVVRISNHDAYIQVGADESIKACPRSMIVPGGSVSVHMPLDWVLLTRTFDRYQGALNRAGHRET